MNVLFSLVMIFNGHAYVIDHDLSAGDCLDRWVEIQSNYEAKHKEPLIFTQIRCEAQP